MGREDRSPETNSHAHAAHKLRAGRWGQLHRLPSSGKGVILEAEGMGVILEAAGLEKPSWKERKCRRTLSCPGIWNEGARERDFWKKGEAGILAGVEQSLCAGSRKK